MIIANKENNTGKNLYFFFSRIKINIGKTKTKKNVDVFTKYTANKINEAKRKLIFHFSEIKVKYKLGISKARRQSSKLKFNET
jgi:hypothetical protein